MKITIHRLKRGYAKLRYTWSIKDDSWSFLSQDNFDTEQEARKNVGLCLSQLREAFGSVMPYDLSKVPVQEGFDG